MSGSINTIKTNFSFVCFLGWLVAPDLADDVKASAGPREGQDVGAAAVAPLGLNRPQTHIQLAQLLFCWLAGAPSF